MSNSSHGESALCIIRNDSRPDRCGWPNDPNAIPTNIVYLDFIAYPVLLALSTIGNALNIFVLNREYPRSSKNVYLVTMAASDLTQMWAELLLYINRVTGAGKHLRTALSGFIFFLEEFGAVASDWIIVAFSIERFLAIRSPLNHKMASSTERSTFVTAGILATSVFLASFRLLDYYWYVSNDLGYPCDPPVRPPVLERLRTLYGWTLILIPTATFITVVCVNGLLMHTLVKKRRKRHQKLRVSVTSSSEPKPSRAAIERSAFLMLAACVVLYLTSQSPAVLLNILEVLDTTCTLRFSKQAKYVANPIKVFFTRVNCSFNFILYSAINPAFRLGLQRQITRLSEKIPRSRNSWFEGSYQTRLSRSCRSLNNGNPGSLPDVRTPLQARRNVKVKLRSRSFGAVEV